MTLPEKCCGSRLGKLSDKCAALAAENARLQKELSEARHALLGIAEMYSDVRDEPEKDWWSALNRAGCFERCAHTQEIAMPLASQPASRRR